MKITVETLLDHPNYMHRVLGYAMRNSRYRDVFGVAGALSGRDRRLYLRIANGKQSGVLGYANDFEIVHHMPSQGGVKQYGKSLWEGLDEKNEASFAKCSAEYTKIMLLLNFDDREEFLRRYIQYKISLFGQYSQMSVEDRKVAVAEIKKESKKYIQRLTKEIYSEAFAFLFDNYYAYVDKTVKHQQFSDFVAQVTNSDGSFSIQGLKEFRKTHPDYSGLRKGLLVSSADPIVSVMATFNQMRQRHADDEAGVCQYVTKTIGVKLREIEKEQQDLQKFAELVEANQDVLQQWGSTWGKKYFASRKEKEAALAPVVDVMEASGTVLDAEIFQSQNMLYCLPQLSNLNDTAGSCQITPLTEVDFAPIFQHIIDDYAGDRGIAKESAQSAERGAN